MDTIISQKDALDEMIAEGKKHILGLENRLVKHKLFDRVFKRMILGVGGKRHEQEAGKNQEVIRGLESEIKIAKERLVALEAIKPDILTENK